MSVPFTLLGLLEREPSHGYDLKRSYDTGPLSGARPLTVLLTGRVRSSNATLARVA
jgi:hypothetical protein